MFGIPTALCNTIEVSGSGTTIGNDTECACPETRNYCENVQGCIPDGEPCGNNSMCTAFSIAPTTSAQTPFTTSYMCSGSGSSIGVSVYSGDALLAYATGASGTITFDDAGSYNVYCEVDGDTGLRCGNGPVSITQITLLLTSIGNALANQGGYLDDVSRTALSTTLASSSYLNVSRAELIDSLQDDVYAYFIGELIQAYPPTTGSIEPSVSGSELLQLQQTVATVTESTIWARCSQELCYAAIQSGIGSGYACDQLTTDDDVDVRAREHTIEYSCLATNAVAGQLVALNCGNGIG